MTLAHPVLRVGRVGTLALALASGSACSSGDEDVGGAGTSSYHTSVASLVFATVTVDASASVTRATASGYDPCPAEQPIDLSPCPDNGGTLCGYGTTQCNCLGSTWICDPCPQMRPATGDACDHAGKQCGYAFLTCECTTPDGWDCGTCPEMPPAHEDVCDRVGLECAFGAYHCACATTKLAEWRWTCSAPCPADAPMPGDACLGNPEEVCDYAETSCVCFDAQFFCN